MHIFDTVKKSTLCWHISARGKKMLGARCKARTWANTRSNLKFLKCELPGVKKCPRCHVFWKTLSTYFEERFFRTILCLCAWIHSKYNCRTRKNSRTRWETVYNFLSMFCVFNCGVFFCSVHYVSDLAGARVCRERVCYFCETNKCTSWCCSCCCCWQSLSGSSRGVLSRSACLFLLLSYHLPCLILSSAKYTSNFFRHFLEA